VLPTTLLPITGGYKLAAVSAAISTLVDDFAGAAGAPNTQRWHVDVSAGGFNTNGLAALNGAGQLVLKNGTSGGGSGFGNDAYVISNKLFDLTGDRLVFRAPQMTAIGAGAYEAGIILRTETNAVPYGRDALMMTLQQDPLFSSGLDAVNFYHSAYVGGAFAQVSTAHVFDAVADYWWSFRETAGTIAWETAPNSGGVPGTWTQWTTFPKASFPAGITNLQVEHYYRVTGDLDTAVVASATFDQIGLSATGIAGAVANASEATTASTLAGTQVQQGAVAGASSADTASTLAGTQAQPGATAGASSATTTSTPAGTQRQVGTVAGASSANTASTPAGTQTVGAVQGAVAGASSAGSTSTPAGSQVQQGTLAGAISGTTAQASAGTQQHAGAIAPEASATAAGTVPGTQRQAGAVVGASSPTTASTPGGTQGQAGTLAGASSADTASTVAGTQRQVGAVANTSSAIAVDPVPGSTGAVPLQGVVAGAASATTTSGLAGTQGQPGAIASATSATRVDAIAPASAAPSGGGSRYLARLLRSQLGPQHAAPSVGDEQGDDALSIAVALITSGVLDMH
jgi:hypothetical protein